MKNTFYTSEELGSLISAREKALGSLIGCDERIREIDSIVNEKYGGYFPKKNGWSQSKHLDWKFLMKNFDLEVSLRKCSMKLLELLGSRILELEALKNGKN